MDQDTATALSYWQRAAAQGDADAARRIGYAYWTGNHGYKGELMLAENHTKVSAAQGDSRIQKHP